MMKKSLPLPELSLWISFLEKKWHEFHTVQDDILLGWGLA